MKAMILAAGVGTRLKPLTNRVPKPMLPVIEKPVIEFIVELLAKYGVREIMINISHLGEVVQSYLRSGYKYGVRIGYSFEGRFDKDRLVAEPIGSAGGLKKIQKETGFFDETFILLCGDAIINFDIEKALDFHRMRSSKATILMKEVLPEKVSNYGIVVSDPSGKVTSFQEKPTVEKAKSNFASTGIVIFEPEILDSIPQGEFYDIGSQLLPSLVQKKGAVYSFSPELDWYDIGRKTDYLSILDQALSGKIEGFTPPGKEITSGFWEGIGTSIEKSTRIITPVYIGSGTRIDKNVRLEGPTTIGANCRIGEGVDLNNVFVDDYVRIGPGLKEKNILLTSDFYVRRDGSSGTIAESPLADYVFDMRTF